MLKPNRRYSLFRWCFSPALLVLLGAFPAVAQPPTGDEILAAVAAHQQVDNGVLTHYTGLRMYRVRNARFQVNATITVRVEFRQGVGKSFKVISRTGSSKAIQRVLLPLLKAETEESKPDRRSASTLNPSNYRAQVIGREDLNGNDCWVLALEPVRHSRFLLRGKLWVDANQMQPVQLEGRPTGNISFWVGEPHITETLARWHGFWLPAHNVSLSSGLLLGPSELTIDYLKYESDVWAPHWTADARPETR